MSIEIRKVPTQKRAKETFDRILSIALDLIIKDGMNSLTTRKIAEAGNIPVGTVYRYFPNKKAILTQLYEKNTGSLREIVNTELVNENHEKDFKDRFYHLVKRTLDRHREQLPFAALEYVHVVFPETLDLKMDHRKKYNHTLSLLMLQHYPHIPLEKLFEYASFLQHVGSAALTYISHLDEGYEDAFMRMTREGLNAIITDMEAEPL
ncbi:TetR/AcrR family transcriptional regulator [Temperatibacter marinus]|uniref:TetR/AcrR family transcriptional regulator n=1 Tax=Temperatibacter marinus TaxID=1456591 RepID=A0AA52HAF2_9PROT|nr:TetR/AcrR family transcriptional regulator [Temperatibacter marinus]WND03562.1 TetR/AcrR family transcriptional regulator [Temperatibacter marinus]